MRNTFKRLLSLLLTFSMVFSFVPATFATETTDETLTLWEESVTEEALDATVEPTEEMVTEESLDATAETTEETVPEEVLDVAAEATEETETEETLDAAVETTEETLTLEEETVTEEALDAAAVTGPNMAAAGMKILSKETTQVAPGVSYEQIISKNSDNQQNIGYLTKVDLTQKITLKAGYKGYYTAGSTAAQRAENYKTMSWGFQPVRQMASDYAAIADPAGTVVMGTNCDYFNMTTGEPNGYLIMEGNTIHTGNEPYFAILKDGSAVIRDAGTDTSDVVEAISGPHYIIRDGVNVGTHSETVFPGNSIGLCDDGSVVFYLNDGRQAPISAGMSTYDLAAVLLDAGCHTALYLDGGGSATLAAREQGASSLEIVNSPSDGYERGVSTALLFVSTASATGEFDHAVITPADKAFAPNAKISFAATGVDTAGFAVDVPSDVSWSLSDSTFGAIDANGLFTAGTKAGKVTIELRRNGTLVGSAEIEISGTVEHALDNAVYDRASGKVICNSCGAELDPVEIEYTDWARDKETGKRMYLLNGKAQTGEFLFGTDTYYFDENGVGYDGEETVDGIKAIFENGLMVGGHTGFITKDDGNTYHYNNGKMTRGWLFLGDDLYHFNPDSGVMTTGKKVQPDEETVSKGVYYDFADDGKVLYGYPNGFGYYYWGGLPHANAWVKNGNTIAEDPDAWYRTNSNGHFVTDGSSAATVKIEVDGVVYTFDNSNGKLLEGDVVVNEDDSRSYYWAGKPVTNKWVDWNGKRIYANSDGFLVTGTQIIDGETYTFDGAGVLITEGVRMSAVVNQKNTTMTVKILDAPAAESMTLAVWFADDKEATLQWHDVTEFENDIWSIDIPMCGFGKTGKVVIHAVADDSTEVLADTSTNVETVTHTYSHQYDEFCDGCGKETRDLKIPTTDQHRMYNPYTGEHFFTGSIEERDTLVAAGWQYEGIGFNFPVVGDSVYRLYDPATGEHLYTMREDEIEQLKSEGWNVEGVAFNSEYQKSVEYFRLRNPYVTVGRYHYTGSVEERDYLISVGWIDEGIGWYSALN